MTGGKNLVVEKASRPVKSTTFSLGVFSTYLANAEVDDCRGLAICRPSLRKLPLSSAAGAVSDIPASDASAGGVSVSAVFRCDDAPLGRCSTPLFHSRRQYSRRCSQVVGNGDDNVQTGDGKFEGDKIINDPADH